jgi:hypothetical protein
VTVLYHAAEEAWALRVLASGFAEQDETKLSSHDRCGVLLSTSPECWDEMPDLVLLAVELPLTVQEAGEYRDRNDENPLGGPLYWVPAARCRGAGMTWLRQTVGTRNCG